MPDERIIKLSPEVPGKIEIDDAGKLCQYVVNQSHISSPEIDNRTAVISGLFVHPLAMKFYPRSRDGTDQISAD